MKMMIHRHDQSDFERMNDMFERLFNPVTRAAGVGLLPIDIVEKDETLLVRASLPGVGPDDVDVQVEGRILTIKGATRSENLYSDAKIYRREVAAGEFSRSLRIADGFDLGAVTAEVDNGIVEVRIPRAESQKARSVKVAVRSQGELKDLPVQEAQG